MVLRTAVEILPLAGFGALSGNKGLECGFAISRRQGWGRGALPVEELGRMDVGAVCQEIAIASCDVPVQVALARRQEAWSWSVGLRKRNGQAGRAGKTEKVAADQHGVRLRLITS